MQNEAFAIGAASLVLVLLSVGIHYEALSLASAVVAWVRISRRMRVVLGLLIALAAHVVEVMVFAAGWAVLIASGISRLSSPESDAGTIIYFSFSTYSSLGYGDIVPVANARILAGIESLTGLVMIAWTASFTYLEMSMYWEARRDDER